jgi:hypothetical protein
MMWLYQVAVSGANSLSDFKLDEQPSIVEAAAFQV